MTSRDLGRIRQTGEGLDRRLAGCIRTTATLEELYAALKTKRYPLARLRRLVLDAALGYGENLPPLPPYIQILGGWKTALPLLKGAVIPAGTSLAQLENASPEALMVARAHSRAQDLFALCCRKPGQMGQAYTQAPVILE